MTSSALWKSVFWYMVTVVPKTPAHYLHGICLPRGVKSVRTFDWREDSYIHNTMQIKPQYTQSSSLRFPTLLVFCYQNYKVSEFKRRFSSRVPFKNLSKLSYLRSYNTDFRQVFSTVATSDLHGKSLLFEFFFKFSSSLLGKLHKFIDCFYARDMNLYYRAVSIDHRMCVCLKKGL